MVSLSKHQFFLTINEIFDSVIRDYGFEIYEENERLVIAKKDGCELIFRLEAALYCSLGIKLSGELAQKATSDPYYRYRELGVSAIAKCLDPSYKRPFKRTETEEDLKDVLERHKEELLKYCRNILLGDVSSWQRVVDCLNRTRINR